jgi:PIN domain nuclease of toxin-antitoxin system
MRILLDTHAFLWWDSEPGKLSTRVANLLFNPEHTIVLSVASIWEIQIKKQLGKLSLSVPLNELIESQQKINDIEILPIHLAHVLTLDSLPPHHKDPFDRILISQVIVEKIALVSADPVLTNYNVEIVWE